MGPADLPAQQTPALPSDQQRTVVPISRGTRSVPLPLLKAQPADANLRSLFGFASRQMSLWSPDRNLKTAATDFKESD
jgi:hypothetical protein